MRADLVGAIRGILSGTRAFASVCGLSSDKPAYPLARVWCQGTPEKNLDNAPQARIEIHFGVQIETVLAKDGDGNSIDGPLYDLADTAFNAMHGYQLPGRGSQKLIVYDSPGLSSFKSEGPGPAVYLMTVTVRVIPENFSLT